LINEKQNSQLTFQDKTKQFGMITQLNTVSCYYVFSLHREEKKKKKKNGRIKAQRRKKNYHR
jgi:hypothetical protein